MIYFVVYKMMFFSSMIFVLIKILIGCDFLIRFTNGQHTSSLQSKTEKKNVDLVCYYIFDIFKDLFVVISYNLFVV